MMKRLLMMVTLCGAIALALPSMALGVQSPVSVNPAFNQDITWSGSRNTALRAATSALAFSSDVDDYRVIYLTGEEESDGAVTMDVEITGPVPADVTAVDLYYAIAIGGEYSHWVVALDIDCSVSEGSFTCRGEFSETFFEFAAKFIITEFTADKDADENGNGYRDHAETIMTRPHSPEILLSEGVFSLTFLAEGFASIARDPDGDGVERGEDNCILTDNPEQENLDGDARGDACDNDIDHDGLINLRDNCPAVANLDQADADGDGTGDACEIEIVGVLPGWNGGIYIDPCFVDPDSDACTGGDDDPDGDGLTGDADQCPDEAEVYTWSSLTPTDGVLDGCPGSVDTTATLGEGEIETEDALSADGSNAGGCSMTTSATAHPMAWIAMALGFLPLVIRRRRHG